MKRFATLLAFICCFLIWSPGEAKADNIRTGGKFGIGIGGGTGVSGVSMKYWLDSSQALQGVVGIWGLGRGHGGSVLGLNGDYLWEGPSLFKNGVIDIGWNLGLGPFLGVGLGEADAFWLGVNGVLGIEFNFVPVPIDITLEYRPGLSIFPDVDADLINFGGHIRYFF